MIHHKAQITTTNGDKASLKEYLEGLNVALPCLFSLIEQKISAKGTITKQDFEEVFELRRRFFNQTSLEVIKDHAFFTRQKRIFTLFERCLNDPETLFPLLLSPFDNLKARCHQETPLLAVYFTESTRANMHGAVHLLILGLQTYLRSSEPVFCEIKNALKDTAS